MSHKPPLFPKKTEACGDVRPLLAEVFRSAPPPCPPVDPAGYRSALHSDTEMLPENSVNIREIRNLEDNLRNEYGKQLTHRPRAADSELSYCNPPTTLFAQTQEDAHFSIIRRQDLMPTALENTDQLRCRWIMNNTSGDTSATESQHEHLNLPPHDVVLSPKDFSIQSVRNVQTAGSLPGSRPPRPSHPPPCCVICEPATLYFVNFTVGHDHVQTVRVVNTSRHEVRLALRPPAHPSLRLVLPTGLARGLMLSSGAALDLRVHFKPRNGRPIRDEMLVRVSRDAPAAVPVFCYLEPPLLDVIVSRADVGETYGKLGAACGVPPTRSPVLDLGARLAGAPHRVMLCLACAAQHAAFYVMTEDAWCSFILDEEAIRSGYLVAGAFSMGPVYWEGGTSGGLAAHRAPTPGLRSAALRLLSSTAVVRPLTIVADSIMFSTEHITLHTPEKEYDILLEGDPACPYYVHLGSAFPERPLAATVHLLNHSAVPYSYYWSVRPWDKILLSAEKRHSEVFSDVIESDLTSVYTESVSAIRVEPVEGAVGARDVTSVHVCAPRAGADCGLHRIVLMLILTNIPRESLGPEYDNVILSTKTIEEEEIPGLCEAWSRTVCEVLVTQMEVWWEVVPLRFVLHPPVLHLTHTKRVSSVELQVEVTQLYAGREARVSWRGDVQPLLPLAPLQAGRSVRHLLRVPLSTTHDDSTTNIFQLEASEGEWRAWCVVTSRCVLPRAALLPACLRLRVAPPAAPLAVALSVCNNTESTVTWRVTIYPWWCPGGVRCASGAAGGAGGVGEQCAVCASSCCVCGALAPAVGELPHAHTETVTYRCHAPALEGNVVNIAQLRVGQADDGCGVPVCSALLAHRALRPRLLLQALHCGCAHPGQCEECPAGDEGDADAGGTEGSAILRPRRALRLGRSESYLLRCVNLTPVATALSWEIDKECSDALKVTFSPPEIEIDAFATVIIQVTLCAVETSARRVWAYRAAVRHTVTDLYLLVDTAVDGLKVSIDIPMEDDNGSVATVIRSECGFTPWDCDNTTSLSPEEIFTDLERRRIKMKDARDIAMSCVVAAAETAAGGGGHEPCACYTVPTAPYRATPCLQFKRLLVGTVQWRQVAVRNTGELPLRWSAHVRRWPHTGALALLHGQCVEEAEASGVRVQCVPDCGVLRPGGVMRLALGVHAHTWGLYFDQLLLQTERMEPVVVDVWVEAVGPPLQFALRPPASMAIGQPDGHPDGQPDEPPVLWMSRSDPVRRLLLANIARCGLRVHTLLLKDHECAGAALPLRAYVRFYDVQRQEIPLPGHEGYIMNFDEDSSCQALSDDNISTGIELIIYDDYGLQVETVFGVAPRDFDIPAGGRESLIVRVREVTAPVEPRAAASLLLLSQPLQHCGEGWYRSDPAPQVARFRLEGTARLQLSRECLRVQLSALRLPLGGVTRVRKYLQALNVGEVALALRAVTEAPWSVTVRQEVEDSCTAGCGEGSPCLYLILPPRTSIQLCCELALETSAVWPAEGGKKVEEEVGGEGEGVKEYAGDGVREQYASSLRADTEVKFYDADEVLLARVSLCAAVEVPTLRARPQHCDFGFVALDDCRKTYFTVFHTSTICALEAVVQCEGAQFAAWPARLSLAPHASARVYVQYAARRGAARPGVEALGTVYVLAEGDAGRWCCARVSLRAAGTRDRARSLPVHDYTDDDHLL